MTTTAAQAGELTDEQLAFREAVREFAARECGTPEQREALTDGYRDAQNMDLYRRIAELGWLGVAIPEEYGGSGGGMVDLCLFLEEISRGLVPVGEFGISSIVAGAYERFGTEEQKQEILRGIVDGNVEAIAMSEPEAGSDVGNLSCRAERTGSEATGASPEGEGEFVINGQKTWISGAHNAAHILLIARSERTGNKHEGLTMISVPTGAEGMEIRPIETMGGREVNDVFFTDCRISAERVLGQEGQAWTQLMAGLNVERLILAAMMLGIGERAFDDVLAYVKERKQFDRPIGSFQTIKHRLADLATELECCRLMVYDVARKVDVDPNRMLPREASMAKLKVTETAKRVALEGMQMMGGYGYASEYDMERHVRATLVSTIYGGTSEIQREIISKTYGL